VGTTISHFVVVLCLAAPHVQNMGCGGASKQSITAPILEKPLPTDIGATKAPELPIPQSAPQPALSLTAQNEVQPTSQPVFAQPHQLTETVPPLLLPTQLSETNTALPVAHSPKLPEAHFPQLPAIHSPPLPQPCDSPLLSPEVLNKRKEQVRDSLEVLHPPKPLYTEASPAGPEVLQEEVLSSARAPLSPSVAQPGKLELSSEASRVLMSSDSLQAEELPSEQRAPGSPPGKPGLLQLASPTKSD